MREKVTHTCYTHKHTHTGCRYHFNFYVLGWRWSTVERANCCCCNFLFAYVREMSAQLSLTPLLWVWHAHAPPIQYMKYIHCSLEQVPSICNRLAWFSMVTSKRDWYLTSGSRKLNCSTSKFITTAFLCSVAKNRTAKLYQFSTDNGHISALTSDSHVGLQ